MRVRYEFEVERDEEMEKSYIENGGDFRDIFTEYATEARVKMLMKKSLICDCGTELIIVGGNTASGLPDLVCFTCPKCKNSYAAKEFE